ncbi:MAG: HlyD family efflux transporter periplasmic adaptor subunit [Bacteroidetes bacterium]|nr:HlyD family efflux transporter periplasmic adaptor subunit [Bacteroidota bacterium]
MRNRIAISIFAFVFASCGNSIPDIRPEYRAITETVFASGTLEPEEKYNLVAQSEGYLIELNFKEGDLVKKGTVLAVVDNQPNSINESAATELTAIAQKNISENAPALKQTALNIELASEKVKQDEAQYNRFKNLLALNSVSKLEFENMQLAFEASKTNLETLKQNYQLQRQQAEQQLINQSAQKEVNSFLKENNKIKALVAGKVYKKMKELGDYVRKGDVLASIGSADDCYARLSVDESNISKIQIGQEALVLLNTNKEKSIKGKVTELLPAFEESTQSFICKVRFLERLPFTISGTQLQANIVIGKKDKVLVIPRAMLDFGNNVNVKGKQEPVKVKTGFISTEWVEITGGLTPSDIILPISK